MGPNPPDVLPAIASIFSCRVDHDVRGRENGQMPTYRDEVVVLRTHKLGEADRIITMLGKSRGKIRAVAKGVRKTGSRIGSRLEPFMVADVQFYEGRNLDTVQQVETVTSLTGLIVADYPMYTTASAMVETADKLTDHGHTNGHFPLIDGIVTAFDSIGTVTAAGYGIPILEATGTIELFKRVAFDSQRKFI